MKRLRVILWILAFTIPLTLMVVERCYENFPLVADHSLMIFAFALLVGLYCISLRNALNDRWRKAELLYLHVIRVPLVILSFGAYMMALGFAALMLFGLPPQD